MTRKREGLTPTQKKPVVASDDAHVRVTRAGSQPQDRGTPEKFMGRVIITHLFRPTQYSHAAVNSVTFDKGARTVWHRQTFAQTLIVTAGMGWVQEWGGIKEEVRPGDVIWTPPGVKHWQGATLSAAMTQVVVHERLQGDVVEWLEPVSQEAYAS